MNNETLLNSIITVEKEIPGPDSVMKSKFAMNPYQFKALKHQLRSKQATPGTLDMDRLNEEEEDFIRVDKKRKLALNSKLLKPMPSER